RWTVLAGLVAGALGLATLSAAAAGPGSIGAFLECLQWMAVNYTGSQTPFAHPHRLVDLNSFFRLLPGGRSIVGDAVLAVLAFPVSIALIRAWVRFPLADRPVRLLIWAATLTWTSVLNIYTSAYDTILVVAAALVTVSAMRSRHGTTPEWLAPATIGVYIAPWVAELLAPTIRVQLYTIALAAFGTLLLREAARS